MKKYFATLLIGFAVLAATPAFALGPLYLGANYMMTTVDINEVSLPDEYSLDAVTLLAGFYLIDILAVEARVGFGAGSDTANSVNSEIDNTYGVYARAELPIGIFRPYVIAGLTSSEFSSDAFSSQDDSDLSYGAGLDLKLTDHFGLNAEYMLLGEYEFSSTKVDVESLSLGLKLYF